jgi:Methyltransferase domain
MNDFETQIRDLDIRLLEHIYSQTTDEDKKSLLAIQRAIREISKAYTYLEIGSYLGGSLQSYTADMRCAKVISIDPRPPIFGDERGRIRYNENTAARMIKNLEEVPGADVAKLATFDAGTDSLAPVAVRSRADICFIDGEHTDAAAVRDSRFCLEILKEDGAIAYHDAHIVYLGIASFLEELEKAGRPFRAFNLAHSVFCIELGSLRLSEHPAIRERQSANYRALLWSLKENNLYRQFYVRREVQLARRLCQPAAQMFRALKAKLRGGGTVQGNGVGRCDR